ncbi:MAG TPA: CsgG/HfaB family protein, partial [Kiritimatiellia bacterium]|nr:CsgG/HfaB family protein [Kiritimatiellia bacterium]
SHAGGEFVFVRQGASIPEEAVAVPAAGQSVRGPEAAAAPSSRELLRDAALLSQQGATGAAHRLLAMTPAGSSNAALLEAVADYLDREREQNSREELRGLIRQLEERKHNAQPADLGAARPRIVACMGPDSLRGGSDDEADALLYRISLRAALEDDGRVRVVERDALETVLQEMDLGASELAEPDARTAIGKVLPASYLLLGTLLSRGDSQQLLMRLVDTETTLALGSFSQAVGPQEDVMAAAGRIAGAMITRLIEQVPLTACVESVEKGRLRAAVGRLHGARAGVQFQLLRRTTAEQESVAGMAAITELGEKQSVLTMMSGEVPAEWAPGELWLEELAP